MGIVGEAWQTIQANLGTWLVAMIFYILIVGAPTLTYSSTRRAAVPFG